MTTTKLGKRKTTDSSSAGTSFETSVDSKAPIPDVEDLVSARVSVANTDGAHPEVYHRFREAEIDGIRTALLEWFHRAKRNMPWRKAFQHEWTKAELAQRAYEVWVSEIMLQQTRVAAVIPYYQTWMAKWPTIVDLSKADIEEVNRVWAGLGYYSRAKRLLEGAKFAVSELDGILPSSAADLEKNIPGVGKYTAGAISSIAYNQPSPLVDGNVIRVLSRLRAVGGDSKKRNMTDLLWNLAGALVDPKYPGDFNQSLMELGATVCVPENPNCQSCPVSKFCLAEKERLALQAISKSKSPFTKKEEEPKEEAQSGMDESANCDVCVTLDKATLQKSGVTYYPLKAKANTVREEAVAVTIVEFSGRFLFVQRPPSGLLANMWEFPSVVLEDDSLAEDVKHCEKLMSAYVFKDLLHEWKDGAEEQQLRGKFIGSVVHVFSHIRQTYHVQHLRLAAANESESVKEAPQFKSKSGANLKWLTRDQLESEAVPTGQKKILALLAKGASAKTSTAAKPKRKVVQEERKSRSITDFFGKKPKTATTPPENDKDGKERQVLQTVFLLLRKCTTCIIYGTM